VMVFAGATPYTRYGWFVRFMMRNIARRRGLGTDTSRDYEYTDWQAVEQFARDLHRLVQSNAVAAS